MFGPELVCLAMTVYFEARSEPLLGQVAVAETVMNRVADRRYPDKICDVVRQGGTSLHRCQFSFYCDGRPERPADQRAWRRAKVIAKLTRNGIVTANLGGATHYHAEYARPFWSTKYLHITTVGRHWFYQRA